MVSVTRLADRRPVAADDRRRVVVVAAVAAMVAAVSGAVAAQLVRLTPGAMVVLAVVPALLAIWRWPHAAVLALLAAALSIEQFSYFVTSSVRGTPTRNIPLFHSVTPGSGVTPAEIFLVVLVTVWTMRAALAHSFGLPQSPLRRRLAVFLGMVVVGLGLGLVHHGDLKAAFWEVRPWAYLALSYVLAASLLTSKQMLRAVLWIMVVASGIKAMQGVVIFLKVRHVQPRPEATLAHEEAYFFGLFVVLTCALWIFGIKGRLRATATALLPLVLFADMGNSRRNAWAVLGMALIVLLFTAYAGLPDRRPMLRRLGVVLLALSCVYFPAFWNRDGMLGQPARALRSAIAPDPRDLQSNQYRQAEDANLLLNIRSSRSLGTGFGVPINYAIPIIDLTNIDKAIAFIPHNGVLYIWMRLGMLGEIAFLALIGGAIVRTGQLSRARDRELAMFGALGLCAVVAYVVQGYNDMGFFWFRIALCLGILLGGVEAALRLAPRPRVGVAA
jgi:hypothetical protein